MSKNKNLSKTRTEKQFLAVLVVMSALIGIIIITSDASAKTIQLTPSEIKMCRDADISDSDCAKVVKENKVMTETILKGATCPPVSLVYPTCTLYAQGIGTADADYTNQQLAISNANDAGFTGTPPPVNSTHVYSSLRVGGSDMHGDFAQGYNKYFGINENYTKTHDIVGIRMSQYKTQEGTMFEKQGILFKNGTEIAIPLQNIGY